MDRILIFAFTANNLGDDLFVKLLCERYPEVKFYIFCRKKNSTAFKEIRNLSVLTLAPMVDTILHRLGISIRAVPILQKYLLNLCDAAVHIGGSVFIQADQWEQDFSLYHDLVISAKRFFVIGANFGPFKADKYRESYSECFDLVDDICFREKYSYHLFPGHQRIRYAPDPVFTFKEGSVTAVKKQIAVSVIDLAGRADLDGFLTEYENKMAELCAYFIAKEYSVKLLSFCKVQGDERAINRILAKLPAYERKSTSPCFYNGNLAEAIGEISSSTYVVATRFHCLVLGWMLGKPVYPIIYSDKTFNVINDLNPINSYCKIQDIQMLDQAEVYAFLKNAPPFDCTAVKSLAQDQFKALDGWLMK